MRLYLQVCLGWHQHPEKPHGLFACQHLQFVIGGFFLRIPSRCFMWRAARALCQWLLYMLNETVLLTKIGLAVLYCINYIVSHAKVQFRRCTLQNFYTASDPVGSRLPPACITIFCTISLP